MRQTKSDRSTVAEPEPKKVKVTKKPEEKTKDETKGAKDES
tara:strand:+ start:271 stop:393 length:123 start_codon:yes stop_codon:yes gene_type:complete